MTTLRQLQNSISLLQAGLLIVDPNDSAALKQASLALLEMAHTAQQLAGLPEPGPGKPCGCNCCEACLSASIQRGQAAAWAMLDQWVKAGRGRGYYVIHGLEGGFV